MFFTIVFLHYSSSRSSLNFSCIFCILFPRFWIIFTIITLISFSGIFPIYSSFIWSCGFLHCSFICNIFLFLLILSNLLCLKSPFYRLQGCSSSCFCCLPPVGEVGPGSCVGFLVRGTSACFLVGGAGSFPSNWQGFIRWCVLGCLWAYMTLGSLSADGWVCVPVLLVVWCGAFSTGACRLLGGARSWSWDGDLWESSHWLIFPGPGILWHSSVLDSMLPPQRLRPDLWPGNKDPASHTAHQKGGGGRKEKERKKRQDENNWKQTKKQNRSQITKIKTGKQQ